MSNPEQEQFLRERVRTPEGEGFICEVDFIDLQVPFRVRLNNGDADWFRPNEIVFLGDRCNFLTTEMRRLTDPKIRAREIFLGELKTYADLAVAVEEDDDVEEAQTSFEQLERQQHILLVLAGLG